MQKAGLVDEARQEQISQIRRKYDIRKARNGLANLFGKQNIPAVGFAPGDETMRLFLENWDLIPDALKENVTLYLPLLSKDLVSETCRLSLELRKSGLQVEAGIDVQTMKQALNYANKKKFPGVIIYGSDEARERIISLKNMQTGEQTHHSKASLIDEVISRFGNRQQNSC